MKLTVLFFILNSFVESYYFPGTTPRLYRAGEKVEVSVNSLTSRKTLLGFDYYDLPVCKPENILERALNLGETLTGNKIENTLYELKLFQEESCKILCKTIYDNEEIEKFKAKIDEEYYINLLIDGILPAATCIPIQNTGTFLAFDHGYHIGVIIRTSMDSSHREYYLNNHIRITVMFHQPSIDSEAAYIVGFEVEPFSVNHEAKGKIKDYTPVCQTPLKHIFEGDYPQKINSNSTGNNQVIWTYDVRWEPSEIKWTHRWDLYVKGDVDERVMWFSIVNSVMILLFLSGMVAMILIHTLRRTMSREVNRQANEEGEEPGWKLLHGDIFRPPSMPNLFSGTVGSGIQFLGMVIVTLSLGAFGLISPGNRGMLVEIMLLSWTFMAPLAGYYSAKTYKMFNGERWYRSTLFTIIFYPGIMVFLQFILNLIVFFEGSTNAIPLGAGITVLALWLFVSVPLTFLGGYFGFSRDVVEFPVKTQDIPRPIPSQPGCMSRFAIVLAGGLLPFGVAFVELFNILNALWFNTFNHSSYVVLLLVFIIFVFICFETTIVFCYFRLCKEDYRWWWESMFIPGSSSLYLFLYSLIFFNLKLHCTRIVSLILFVGYMTIFSLMFFLGSSVVGYIAGFWFVWKIFDRPVIQPKLNEVALLQSHEAISTNNSEEVVSKS